MLEAFNANSSQHCHISSVEPGGNTNRVSTVDVPRLLKREPNYIKRALDMVLDRYNI